MADQPAGPQAPRKEEQIDQVQEDRIVNPPPESEIKPESLHEEPSETQEEEEMDDDRAQLYARIDAQNKSAREAKSAVLGEVQFEEEEGQERPAAAPEEGEAPVTPAPPAEEPEKPEGPIVLSRAEFLEVFKDYRIKDKVAGEMVDAPVEEWVRATGLEKHYTKRLMDISRKEREILDRAAKTTKAPEIPQKSEKEIQERYDELFMESPFKAQQFLREMEAAKKPPAPTEEDETLRARNAYEEFSAAYPDLSQEDWARMNNPVFWQKYPDVIEARNGKEWFRTFVLAHNHLQREKLDLERHVVAEQMRKKAAEDEKTLVAKKRSGAVIRTSVAPQRVDKGSERKAGTQEEDRRAYIRSLQKASRARMNIV